MTAEKRATVISSATATLLILVKAVVGLFSGSVAVLASAIDSALDLAVSAFNYFAISRAEKPANERFNYGLGKIEGLAAAIEGAIILLSGLFILYKAGEKLYTGATTQYLDTSIAVMLFSILVTGLLVAFLSHTAKKTNNLVVKADALHYRTDLYSNAAILVSLGLVSWTGLEIFDSLAGAAIAVYIIWSAYGILREGVLNLLDVALDEDMVAQIRKIIMEEPHVTSYHYLRTRRSGNTNFLDVHLVFNGDISLAQAHAASDNVERRVAELDKRAKWVFNVHLDPVDDSVEQDGA